MNKVVDQIVQIMENLPPAEQNKVWDYTQILAARFPERPNVGNPYPLRGTASVSLDPSEGVFVYPQNSPTD